MKNIWIMSIVFLAIGCHSTNSLTSSKVTPCPEMTFVIDSLQIESGTKYLVKITYFNHSEKTNDFYLRGRISVVAVNPMHTYGFPGWHTYLRPMNDLNSTIILKPDELVIDSLNIPLDVFQEMKGKELMLGRSHDQEVKGELTKKGIYLYDQVCPMLSTNSVFVP